MEGGLLALDHCQALHVRGWALVPCILLDGWVEEARDETVAEDLSHRGQINIPQRSRVGSGEDLSEPAVPFEQPLLRPMLGQGEIHSRSVAVRRDNEGFLEIILDLVESPGVPDVYIAGDECCTPGHSGLQRRLHTRIIPSRDIRYCLEAADPSGPCRGVPRFLEQWDFPHPAGGRGRSHRRHDAVRDSLAQGLDVRWTQSEELGGPRSGRLVVPCCPFFLSWFLKSSSLSQVTCCAFVRPWHSGVREDPERRSLEPELCSREGARPLLLRQSSPSFLSFFIFFLLLPRPPLLWA